MVHISYRHAQLDEDGVQSTPEERVIIREHHFYISDDRSHSAHFVQHCFHHRDSWMCEHGITCTQRWIWSDGCGAQFKSARPLVLHPHSLHVMVGMYIIFFGVLMGLTLILVDWIMVLLMAHSNCIASRAHHTVIPRYSLENMHVFVRVVLMVFGTHAKIQSGLMHILMRSSLRPFTI